LLKNIKKARKFRTQKKKKKIKWK